MSPASAGGVFTTEPPGKPYNGILLTHKKEDEMVSFVMMWMDLESVTQNEIRKRKKFHLNVYTWNLEK